MNKVSMNPITGANAMQKKPQANKNGRPHVFL